MKNFIYSVFFVFSLATLASCQKEMVNPDQSATTGQTQDGRKMATCDDQFYYYNYKPSYLGKVNTGRIIIGFEDSFTHQDKVNFIAGYPFLDSIQYMSNSGSADITVVTLQPGATCSDVENYLNTLAQQPAVRYANPTFKPSGSSYEYLGITNQFVVTLKENATTNDLQNLVNRTNTQIVGQLSGTTYIISAVKTSNGNALEMANFFHEQKKVDYAEPDFLMVMPQL